MTSGRDGVSQATLSADLLHGVFETSPVGLVVVDRVGTVTHVNERTEQILDLSTSALVGQSVFDERWGTRDDRGEPLSDQHHPVGRALTGVATDGQELSAVLPTGRRVDFRVNCAPVRDGDGRVTAAVAAFEDRTATTLRERELTAKNRQLESLASVLSHDLRNPLSIARGYLDLAQETGELSHLDRVADAHERMEELIDSLLLLARRGRAIGPREPVSLADAARTAWATVDTGTATVTVADGLGTVDADRVRLQQLFENLFRNSVEHGGGAVHVSVTAREHGPGFVVSDDGPGVPGVVGQVHLEQYLDATEDIRGLGLKIVQAVADGHGWAALLAPQPGGGVRFEFDVGGSATS